MRKAREYTAVYRRSGRWIVAWLEEIPGVNTQGRTITEARENLADALKMVLRYGRNRSESTGRVKKEPFFFPVTE